MLPQKETKGDEETVLIEFEQDVVCSQCHVVITTQMARYSRRDYDSLTRNLRGMKPQTSGTCTDCQSKGLGVLKV